MTKYKRIVFKNTGRYDFAPILFGACAGAVFFIIIFYAFEGVM